MAENLQTTRPADEGWTTVIRPKTGWFDIDLQELWRYRDLIMMFVKRNFTVLYKQTILGPAWIILNPLITTVIFNVVFGGMANMPPTACPAFCSTWPAIRCGPSLQTASTIQPIRL